MIKDLIWNTLNEVNISFPSDRFADVKAKIASKFVRNSSSTTVSLLTDPSESSYI